LPVALVKAMPAALRLGRCIRYFVIYPPLGSVALEREISTPLAVPLHSRSMAACTFCHTEQSKLCTYRCTVHTNSMLVETNVEMCTVGTKTMQIVLIRRISVVFTNVSSLVAICSGQHVSSKTLL